MVTRISHDASKKLSTVFSTSDELRRDIDEARARIVQRQVERMTFIIAQIIRSFFFQHRERVDVVLGHVEVGNGVAALIRQLAQVVHGLGH